MKILPYTELDNIILQSLLQNGEQEIADLLEDLARRGQQVSIQAIYKRIRNLIHSGIIIKSGKAVAVNNEWVEEMLDMLGNSPAIPRLKEGESASYAFKSLNSLDAYWKHIMAPLEREHPDFPIFFYNPYEIWINLSDRFESESSYLKKFEKNKQWCFFSLGKENTHNHAFKASYQSEYLQISVGNEEFKDRDYITVFADYVITTKLSPALAKQIDQIYQSDKITIISEKIDKLFIGSAALKLKIERNANKAKKLRKKISKDFFIPKEIKETYHLF